MRLYLRHWRYLCWW